MRCRFSVLAFVSASLIAAAPHHDRALELYNHTEYLASLKLLLPEADKDPADLALIGQNYFMLGDAKRASEFFQRAVTASPNHSEYYHWLGRAYGRRAEMASMFSAMSQASKARQNLEKAVELDPNNSEAVNDLFEFYLEAPHFIGGGLEKAAQMADRIAEHDPAEGHYARARIEEKRKAYRSAEEHLRRAMELAPRQVGRVIDLAKFLAMRGRFEECEKTFQAAEKIAPNAPKLMYARAATYIEAKRNIRTARNLLEKYLAAPLTPDDPPRSEARKLLQQVSGG
jgi:tetratricopeptide (TPR) repeat protein